MKTKAKTLILILLLTLSMASLINIRINLPTRVDLPQTKQENEELNPSLPITPEYKYHYENDFDYSTHTNESGYVVGLYGNADEWSQDPNDDIGLHLNYLNYWLPGSAFFISGILFVESCTTFKKQNDINLGAYIDWHIALNVLVELNLDINSIEITLMILGSAGVKELISIYDPSLSSQEGRFYIPNS
ncbi:unnamed protein product [marine sediment metagenome]|uniref:Uncharacterized protein n=1 Tax=marine sediment metagenome TaxID=412755 RepID=X0YE99_9ZZZZ